MSKGSLRKYLHTVGDQEGRAKSLASLDKVINLYASKFDPKTDLSVLASSEVVGAVNRLKEFIENDMIGDPKGVTLYFCLDEDAPTRKYYTSRGSSQLESFWKSLEVSSGESLKHSQHIAWTRSTPSTPSASNSG